MNFNCRKTNTEYWIKKKNQKDGQIDRLSYVTKQASNLLVCQRVNQPAIYSAVHPLTTDSTDNDFSKHETYGSQNCTYQVSQWDSEISSISVVPSRQISIVFLSSNILDWTFSAFVTLYVCFPHFTIALRLVSDY